MSTAIQIVERVDKAEALLTEPRALDNLAKLLPAGADPDRFARRAAIACAHDPKLLQCTRTSFYTSVMRSAEWGLDCSGTLGEAYLVPIKKNIKQGDGSWLTILEAHLWIGYKGLIKLVRKSPDVETVEAHVVTAREVAEGRFVFRRGTSPTLLHEPIFGDESQVVGAYYFLRLKSGAFQVETMSLAEMQSIKARSKSDAWKTDENEMYRKTVAKRGCKWSPQTPLVAEVVAYDNEHFGVDTVSVGDADQPKQLTGPQRAREQMRANRDAQAATVAEAATPEPEQPQDDGPPPAAEPQPDATPDEPDPHGPDEVERLKGECEAIIKDVDWRKAGAALKNFSCETIADLNRKLAACDDADKLREYRDSLSEVRADQKKA